MNRDEMKKVLDLGGVPLVATPGASVFSEAEAAPPPPPPPPPTALVLDEWERTKGGLILDREKELGKLPHLGGERQHRADAMADFYGVAYQPAPAANAKCTDKRRLRFVKALLGNPSTQSLRAYTRYSPMTSELAAIRFAGQFDRWVEEDIHKEEERERKEEAARKAREEAEREEADRKDAEDEVEPEEPEPSEDAVPDGDESPDEPEADEPDGDDEDESPDGEDTDEPDGDDTGDDAEAGDGDGATGSGDGDGTGDDEEGDADASGDPSGTGGDSGDSSTALDEYDPDLDRAIREAVEEARDDAEKFEEARAVTSGMGGGSYTSKGNDPLVQLKLHQRVKGDPNLQKIIKECGRLQRLACQKQRTKPCHGMDEMVGITLDGEISRLLVSELGYLTHPATRMDALLRLTQRKSPSRKHQSIERAGKGPMICVVDESSSMHGAKNNTAKALAMTIAMIAAKQRRWCCLLAYSGQERSWRPLLGESSHYHRMLVLKPGEWDCDRVLSWLENSLTWCGSDMDVPLRELPGLYRDMKAPVGKTDVLMITDAICNPSAKLVAEFKEWKLESKAMVYTLVIDSYEKTLSEVSDQVWNVPIISADSPEIGEVLSI